jgi:glycosyltransferase involved in cell wall biosynthesis
MTAARAPRAHPAPEPEGTAVVAFPARPDGGGGLGHFSAEALAAAAPAVARLFAFGPLPGGSVPDSVTLEAPPLSLANWRRQYTWRRYLHGRYQYETDTRFGRWLAGRLSRVHMDRAYLFTQIARESLTSLRDRGVPTILDNPNGHIAHYRLAVRRECERWVKWPYWGHPCAAMVARVESEYSLASVIRVASPWARQQLVTMGVAAEKVVVVPPRIDIDRFHPTSAAPALEGPLRLVFVGSVSLGKGFPYLLTAMHQLGASRVRLEVVGATGDPWSRRLFETLARGLQVNAAPGDPRAAYAHAEALVLPTVHDGFGLVVGEAMACGLPVVTTDQCGASDWVESGTTGAVVPAGDQDALTGTLAELLRRRRDLAEQGRAAREAVVRRMHSVPTLADFVAEWWRRTPHESSARR